MLFDPSQQDETYIPIATVPHTNIPVVLVSVLGGLAWLTIGLRVFTRTYLIRNFGWDDVAMIAALVFFSVYNVGFVMSHLIVSGKSSLSLRQFKDAVVWMLISEHFYTLGILTLKISLGIFFLRIMVTKWQKWVIYITITISTVFGFSNFFFSVFQCGYFSSIWVFLERKATLEHCVSRQAGLAMGYTQSTISTGSDWMFAILPIFVLRNLHIGDKEKATVLFILSLAAAGSIASIVRFRYIPALVENSTSFFGHILGLAVWSCVEMGLGVIAGSLATLRPLFRQFFLLSSLSRHGRSRTAGASSYPSSYGRSLRKKRLNTTTTTTMTGRSTDSDSGRKHGRGVRKSNIGWPLTYGTQTTITVGTGRTPVLSRFDDLEREWDLEAAAMLDGPEQYEQKTFGVLNPLPAIPPRSHKRDLMRNVELKPMQAGTRTTMDRRHSAPG